MSGTNGNHPTLDIAQRTWTTSEGVSFKLRPVRALIVERIVNDLAGKPEVPQIEVTIGGKHKRLEENPGDPTYLEKLDEWTKGKNYKLAFFLFTAGIEGTPPKAFCEEYANYFPDASDMTLKYLWVCSLIPDSQVQDAMAAIMGQTEITAEGLEQAAATFQSDGERQPN